MSPTTKHPDNRFLRRTRVMARSALPLCLLSLVFVGCAATGEMTLVERWHCRNDLEVSCSEGTCEAEIGDGFTPMSVHVDDSGAISVCAYSGCWEGTGEVLPSEKFLVLIGHDLEFSTSRESESSGADVVLAIDRADRVAALKAGEFTHPLLCKNLGVM